MTGAGAAQYPRAASQLRPEDVGRRVTVRRQVPGGFRDTIGELVSLDDGYAEVRRSDGEVVRLPHSEIVASRVVGRR